MVSRAEAKEKKCYATYYVTSDGQAINQEFFTKEANDSFAHGLEFMDVKTIEKSYYNPVIREWYRYHNDKDIQETNRLVRGEHTPLMDE